MKQIPTDRVSYVASHTCMGRKKKKRGSGGVGRRGERKNETPANEAWKAVYRFTAGVYV